MAQQQKRTIETEPEELARALGVSELALEANGSRLWFHGWELLEIERAYRRSVAAGRYAVVELLNQYVTDGYASGREDGVTCRRF